MISRPSSRVTLPVLFLLLLLASRPGVSRAVADDAPAKKPSQTMQDVGRGFKDLGRKIGDAGRQVGHEVAEAARKVWYKGRQVSEPKLEQVQERTREFWSKVIEGKDRTLEQLRRENAELKRRAAGQQDSQ